MLKKLIKRIWHGIEIQKTYNSESLGSLKFDETIRCWSVKKKIGNNHVVFTIGGVASPDKVLVTTIENHLKNFNEFEQMVLEYLRLQSKRLGEFSDEILNLSIKEIIYSKPSKPTVGMVFFKKSPSNRIWHLDIIEGKPDYLTFDS